jgi:hypothetical protein
MAFSFGLLLQVFGQSVYSYYNLFAQIQAPYPSLGDVGFFGSIFAYLYGIILVARVAGVKVSLTSYANKIQAVLIPLAMLTLSYIVFLQNYQFTETSSLATFLDFVYPLGQALYVSVAILTLILSRKVLGGIMREPILFLVFALVIQYCSDSNFLYQAGNNSWYVGGYGDYMYLVSYLFMTLALIYVGQVFDRIRRT